MNGKIKSKKMTWGDRIRKELVTPLPGKFGEKSARGAKGYFDVFLDLAKRYPELYSFRWYNGRAVYIWYNKF